MVDQQTDLNQLTPRETEAVRILTYGPASTNQGIAEAMNVRAATIERYLEVARQKTGTRNRVELLRWGRDNLGPEPEKAGTGVDREG